MTSIEDAMRVLMGEEKLITNFEILMVSYY